MSKHLESEAIGSGITVGGWTFEKIDEIHQKLEVPNWAPWLSASKQSLVGRAEVFPAGQLLVLEGETPVASLSMNRIDWDGNPLTLPCWDNVAGDPTTYEHTYKPSGNTLVMMSMNVDPASQGKGLARKLIEQSRFLAVGLDVDYLIGSFRPNEFGKYKSEPEKEFTKFEDYIQLKRPDGLPIDSWLRNLTRNGMQALHIDDHAMTVSVAIDEFQAFKTGYNVGMWKEIYPGVWECGEVGVWKVDSHNGSAIYKESNLWGLIWKKPGLQ